MVHIFLFSSLVLQASMASIKASVSLFRIQSISCRWDRSPALSRRRRPGMRPPRLEEIPDLGRTSRLSKRSTRMRSTSRIVSRMLHSLPPSALSMASGKSERSRLWVIEAEPWHKVDRRLTTVEIVAAVLLSAPQTTHNDQTNQYKQLSQKSCSCNFDAGLS